MLLLLLAHLNGVYTVAFLILLLVAEGVSAGFSGGHPHFGQAEVTIYRGNTARVLLQEWREGLLHRTAGRVYAPF
jgi:hypothetical protein